MRSKKAVKLVLIALLLASAAAFADTIVLPPDGSIDPSTLHVGSGYGTACATGCMGDPNVINVSTGHGDIYQNSGGAGPMTYLAVIIAVANGNSSSLGSGAIFNATLYNPGPASTSVSVSAVGPTANGYQANLTSSVGGDVYTAMGITGANNSNSFGNLSAYDQAHFGLTVNNFAIFAYKINISGTTVNTLLAGGTLDFQFAGIPQGSYVLGYGLNGDKQNIFSTPFTESGSYGGNTVPEPASLALFGSGLLGLGGVVGRKIYKIKK